jgi:hypothetical protein
MNKKGNFNLSNLFIIIFGVYFIYLLISEFTKITPSFGVYGWTIFGALMFGLVFYLKYKLFG